MTSFIFNREEKQSWEQWINRYPSWCHGGEAWREQSYEENGRWNHPNLPQPLALPQRRVLLLPSVPLRPRVFVSHRQADVKYAERIADLADQSGFYFWLDVVNLPPPSVIANMTALSIALRIEMALMNCSHIVAVYTDATPGSTWVPYEYGRVKEPVLQTTMCCAWLYVQNPQTTIVPEWLELNQKYATEWDLVQWFNNEYNTWGVNLPSPPAGQWQGSTNPLP